MARYVGLDLSLSATGVADLNDGVESGIVIKSKMNGVKRLVDLQTKLRRELTNGQLPDAVCVEGYAMGKGGGKGSNSGRVFDIGEWGGIVRVLLQELNIPTYVVPPKTLKMFAALNGNASKTQMIEAMAERFGVVTKDDNIADAYGLAYMAMTLSGDRETEHTKEEQSLEKCKQIIWKESRPSQRIRRRTRT